MKKREPCGAVFSMQTDVGRFVVAMERLFNSCDLSINVWVSAITPVQPMEMGSFVPTEFKSKFSPVDAKQAFLDTLLAEALVVGTHIDDEHNQAGAGDNSTLIR